MLLWGTYYIENTLQWPWPSEINLKKRLTTVTGKQRHRYTHCTVNYSPPLLPVAHTHTCTHTQTDSFITLLNSQDNRASLNFFRVAQASNARVLAVVVLPSVMLQGTNILFSNPREKFKKVCLPWLCYLMCTRGNVNPEIYSTVLHTVLVPTLSRATQIAAPPKLIANTAPKNLGKSSTASAPLSLYLSVWMRFDSNHRARSHKNSLNVSGRLEWWVKSLQTDVREVGSIEKCMCAHRGPTVTGRQVHYRHHVTTSVLLICTVAGRLRQNTCVLDNLELRDPQKHLHQMSPPCTDEAFLSTCYCDCIIINYTTLLYTGDEKQFQHSRELTERTNGRALFITWLLSVSPPQIIKGGGITVKIRLSV